MITQPEIISGNNISVFVLRAFCLHDDIASSCLSLDEKLRAGRFKRSEDARRWTCFRAALRHVLGAEIGITPESVEFILNPAGKPELTPPHGGLHFNLSHCDDLAVIALSNKCEVGIDIESNKRAMDLLECESTFSHPAEISELPSERGPRSSALLERWTAKEAFLKAIGTGLSNPPEGIRVQMDGDSRMAITNDGASLPLTRLRHPSLEHHTAHLCALRPIDSIEILVGLPHEEQVRPS